MLKNALFAAVLALAFANAGRPLGGFDGEAVAAAPIAVQT